jgi:hypothetical protein
VYTFDDWTTTQVIPAAPSAMTERWQFTVDVPPGAQDFKFALHYTVGDSEFWTNNDGSNYSVHVAGP